ncbi:hypothetical protein HDU97_005601 [Phlyctochytrium planicorne]|nr:hypothetical protein HDU97_005601 [Phlyctochytrium planicorne]
MSRAAVLSKTFVDLNLEKPAIISVPPTSTIEEALAVMGKSNIISIPITSRVWPNRYIAILSLLDILQFFLSNRIDLSSTVEAALTLDPEQESYRVFERDERDTLESTMIAFAKGTHRILVTDAMEKRKPMIVTQTDILRYMQKTPSLYATSPISFSASLKSLGFVRKTLASVRVDEPAIEGYKRMSQKRIAALPVVDKVGMVVDTLSVSDLRGLGGEMKKKVQLNVEEFVKASPTHKKVTLSVADSDTLADVLNLIVENRAHRAWVLDEMSRPVGVISQSDIIGAAVGIPIA